ncbi:uncharacterized protein UV8b_02571 [Ustilaginoidea virens]|uniref:Uncharacterized protein n=1 Tax=Ustilaginoidea virens TaxID=1159556 RepID=A0A8E5HN55_USTVR|nr:uncharacterized protein UV8b_02571 [Ustilaginoidea virens]QUC18330.1 hypothetical protein UV8b_02571 [Ustilaginoidea virens]
MNDGDKRLIVEWAVKSSPTLAKSARRRRASQCKSTGLHRRPQLTVAHSHLNPPSARVSDGSDVWWQRDGVCRQRKSQVRMKTPFLDTLPVFLRTCLIMFCLGRAIDSYISKGGPWPDKCKAGASAKYESSLSLDMGIWALAPGASHQRRHRATIRLVLSRAWHDRPFPYPCHQIPQSQSHAPTMSRCWSSTLPSFPSIARTWPPCHVLNTTPRALDQRSYRPIQLFTVHGGPVERRKLHLAEPSIAFVPKHALSGACEASQTLFMS